MNDVPLTTSETLTIDEGKTLYGLFKATDVEQEAITYALASGSVPDGFTFTDPAAGTFTFTPAVAANTADRTFAVGFTATDASGGIGTGTMTIIVRSVNVAPLRLGSSTATYSMDEDTVLTGNLNVTDPNGDAITYQVFSGVQHGTLSAISAEALGRGQHG